MTAVDDRARRGGGERRAAGNHGSDAVKLPSPRRFGQAFALLRVLMGLVFLLNGLAKLFEFHAVVIGPYVANLIDRADTRFILNIEANKNAQHPLPGIRPLVNHVFLAHYGFWQWAFTAAELGIGTLLVLGLASRLGALLGVLQTGFLFSLYLSNDRWVFEQPLEVVPLLLLLWIPAGRVWGLDGSALLPARLRARWPF